MADFAKIEQGIIKGVPDQMKSKGYACVHKCVPWAKRCWYFGTSAVTNPSRPNCMNYECFQGGYAAIHELPNWKCQEFPQILDYNYAQDFVFPILDHMYMFVYSRFDGFYFYGIYQWCDETGGWKESSMQKNGDYTMSRDGDCSAVQCNSQDQETAYIVLLGQKTDHLKVFELKKNAQWENFIDLNTICCQDNATGIQSCHLLQACVKDRTIYCLLGTISGQCGTVTWDSCKMLKICLDSCTATLVTCQGDPNGQYPTFPNGPRCAVQDGCQWVMVGGRCSASGDFCRDIWILDLDQLTWRKSSKQVPQDLDGLELCACQMDSILFVADYKHGIYNYPIQNL